MRFKHLLCGLSLVIMVVYGQHATKTLAQTQQAQTPQTQLELRQQVHSREVRGGIPGQIPQRLATESGDIRLYNTMAPAMVIQAPPLDTLWNLACENELAVLGKIGNGTSSPTVDQGYIYTDWDLTVEEIIKNNAKSPVHLGQTITVTRPGGTLVINGRRVYATTDSFRQFHTAEDVLVYLRYLPSTGTYSLSEPNGFGFSGSTRIDLGGSRLGQFGSMQKDALLDLARQAVGGKCLPQGGQK